VVGRYDKAIEMLKEAIDRYPDAAESIRATVKVANCHYYLDQLDHAAIMFQRAQWSYAKLFGKGEILKEPWVELAIWRQASERFVAQEKPNP